MIKPHGGKLVNRIIRSRDRSRDFSPVNNKSGNETKVSTPKIYLNSREISDLEMIATGAFSPLEGFMNKENYESVLNNSRLSNGIVWTIPITLAVSDDEARDFKEGEDILLYGTEVPTPFAILHLEEKYKYNKEEEARKIFKTTDERHPGVAYLYSRGDVLLGGKIDVFGVETSVSLPTGLKSLLQLEFSKYYLTPEQTRKIFKERGWKTVVGFQTRNPIHRAHEYLQKCTLEIVDGLFIHPIVGETKGDDIPADVRMKCYETLIENYYPKDRVLLCINPAYMRYAGPKEAIFHAIVRKNYGCTHFIVGRDHAGVGNYYAPFDAQYIFDEFKKDELEITPLFFDNSFYCKKCRNMATGKTCPHSPEEHFSLSGTKVRELLKEGEIPPVEFTRPEVADILIEWYLNTR